MGCGQSQPSKVHPEDPAVATSSAPDTEGKADPQQTAAPPPEQKSSDLRSARELPDESAAKSAAERSRALQQESDSSREKYLVAVDAPLRRTEVGVQTDGPGSDAPRLVSESAETAISIPKIVSLPAPSVAVAAEGSAAPCPDLPPKGAPSSSTLSPGPSGSTATLAGGGPSATALSPRPMVTPRTAAAASKPPPPWQRGALIGQGGFGKVYIGLDLECGQMIAVKEISFQGTIGAVQAQVQALMREISLMRGLDHRNVVRYIGVERRGSTLNILMEYIPGGSLASLVSKFGALAENVVRVYAAQILEGLAYLHSHKILHRDIKGANILVHTDGTIKLADFGASKQLAEMKTITDGFASMKGTPYWMAPEVIKQTSYGRGADIWSVACTVIEMATGRPPWSDFQSAVAAMFHIADTDDVPKLPDGFSEEGVDFLRLCFDRDPRSRPSAADLLQHPWITREPTAAQPTRVPNGTVASSDTSAARATAAPAPGALVSSEASAGNAAGSVAGNAPASSSTTSSSSASSAAASASVAGPRIETSMEGTGSAAGGNLPSPSVAQGLLNPLSEKPVGGSVDSTGSSPNSSLVIRAPSPSVSPILLVGPAGLGNALATGSHSMHSTDSYLRRKEQRASVLARVREEEQREAQQQQQQQHLSVSSDAANDDSASSDGMGRSGSRSSSAKSLHRVSFSANVSVIVHDALNGTGNRRPESEEDDSSAAAGLRNEEDDMDGHASGSRRRHRKGGSARSAGKKRGAGRGQWGFGDSDSEDGGNGEPAVTGSAATAGTDFGGAVVEEDQRLQQDFSSSDGNGSSGDDATPMTPSRSGRKKKGRRRHRKPKLSAQSPKYSPSAEGQQKRASILTQTATATATAVDQPSTQLEDDPPVVGAEGTDLPGRQDHSSSSSEFTTLRHRKLPLLLPSPARSAAANVEDEQDGVLVRTSID